MIMRNLEDKGGVRIDNRVINNLRYADDTVILAETEHELQHLIIIINNNNNSCLKSNIQ